MARITKIAPASNGRILKNTYKVHGWSLEGDKLKQSCENIIFVYFIGNFMSPTKGSQKYEFFRNEISNGHKIVIFQDIEV